MQPTVDALQLTIHRAVQRLRERSDDAESQWLIDVIEACNGELKLQADAPFWRSMTARAKNLEARGLALAKVPAGPHGIDRTSPAGEGACDAPAGRMAYTQAIGNLGRLVHDLRAVRDATSDAWRRDVCELERELHARRLLSAFPPEDGARSVEDMRVRFQAYMRGRSEGDPTLEICAFSLRPGGFSKQTILASARNGDGMTEDFVLRIEPPEKLMELESHVLRFEYPSVRYAFEQGLPVAEPLWLENDCSILGGPFMVSRRLGGEIIGSVVKAGRLLDGPLLGNVAATLAAVHRVQVDPSHPLIAQSHLAHWARCATIGEASRKWIDYWSGQIERDGIEPSPLLTLGLQWLQDNVPHDDAAPRLLHGDFGLHNLMIENDRVVGILDWEMVRVGDPAEELAAFFAGTGDALDRDAFLAAYRDAGGPVISPFRLAYFNVFNVVFGITGGLSMLSRASLPRSNVKAILFGLRYIQHYVDNFESALEAAESLRAEAC